MARRYQRTDVRRRQIAEAALALIAERGLDGFTTRALGSRVGLTDGTIFRHFDSKAEIVLAALDVLEERMFAVVPDDPDPLIRLEAMFAHRARFVAGEGLFGRLVFTEQLIHVAGDAARVRLRALQARNFAVVEAALGELGAAGRLAIGGPPARLLPVFQGLVLTFAFEAALERAGAADTLDARIRARWETFRALAITPG
ncbi:MAG: TetR/AcrR family transcriptional regulator [Kofleriaceae bacterium]|nr:TetR/AcrR family transcriptional regulator [Myxococcales bacterium]MCB9564958.1 TetR/AcrR family transcriptional regulator [Kofleriaceae bacterium]